MLVKMGSSSPNGGESKKIKHHVIINIYISSCKDKPIFCLKFRHVCHSFLRKNVVFFWVTLMLPGRISAIWLALRNEGLKLYLVMVKTHSFPHSLLRASQIYNIQTKLKLVVLITASLARHALFIISHQNSCGFFQPMIISSETQPSQKKIRNGSKWLKSSMNLLGFPGNDPQLCRIGGNGTPLAVSWGS